MTPSLTKLHKFFRLEAERKFDNRAVLGGLENLLESWEPEARADQVDEALLKVIGARLKDYNRLSPEGRAEALDGLWSRIQREAGLDAPSDKPKTAKPDHKTTPAPPQKKAAQSAPPPEKKAKTISNKPPDGPAAALDAAVTVLDGVGPKNAERLQKLGIQSLRDLLYHFPRRHDDYTQLLPIGKLKHGEEVTVIGSVQSKNVRPAGKGKAKIAEVVVDDGTAAMRITWFNQPWVIKNLNVEDKIVLSGRIDQYLGRLTMNNPELEMLDAEQLHTNRIVPVYPLTEKIGQRWLRSIMSKVVQYWAPRVRDSLPDTMIKSAELFPLHHALLQAHFPDSFADLGQAQHRLAFDELFLLQLAVLQQKHAWEGVEARSFIPSKEWLEAQLKRLPYKLTKAQTRTLQDLQDDLGSGRPMNRLLQGDVGSGKTVVAALAMATVANDGAQAAIMAPTSILAEQHYRNMLSLLSSDGGPLAENEISLIIGATPSAEKRKILAALKNGAIKIVIGTHTLIEDPVLFSELELIVIDEQHRFGVQQRAALRAKGDNPHLLVMTATPIPRSLALTLYGDLDLSVIDELPPGRQDVGTHILFPRERERAYSLIRKQVENGKQAFIIYPLVAETEKSDAKAAVEEHERLQKEIFPDIEILLLHGRLSADEKESTMARFRDGEAQIMVSTSVIEVGVDVPDATVMLIEGANRFGLAQLHQFRGRVGRSSEKSYCILLPDNEDAAENERLKAMVETNDGFLLAERDLEHRGPGDFIGTKQSGFDHLHLANLADARLIDKARRHAQELLSSDPELALPEHKALHASLKNYWNGGKGDVS
jgi:ATP-dependent DNA helicase RecG